MSDLVPQIFSWKTIAWLIPTAIAVYGVALKIKSSKINYDRPKIRILNSFATPGYFPSKIELFMSNPSNFDNSICRFELRTNQNFHLSKTLEQKDINIPLPKTSSKNSEISLNFEVVKYLRGRKAVLVLTDLKGSKIKKSFKFMPSYNLRKVKRAIRQIGKNV